MALRLALALLSLARPLPALLAARPPTRRTILRATRQRWPVERFLKTTRFFRQQTRPTLLTPLLRLLGLESKETLAVPRLRYSPFR